MTTNEQIKIAGICIAVVVIVACASYGIATVVNANDALNQAAIHAKSIGVITDNESYITNQTDNVTVTVIYINAVYPY